MSKTQLQQWHSAAIPPMLSIENKHSQESGTPPDFRPNDAAFLSYYQNAYGEQWVCRYQAPADYAELWSGDAGWEDVYRVTAAGITPGLILSKAEQTWLAACWMTIDEIRKAQ